MARLEDLKPNASVRGILQDELVTVVSVLWSGSAALELTYMRQPLTNEPEFGVTSVNHSFADLIVYCATHAPKEP